MYKRFDPFEGMTPAQRAESIFKNNKTYNDDIVDLIEFLGGEANIKTATYADKKALEELKNFDSTSSFLVIKVNKFEDTGFKDCSLRVFNGYLDCFHVDKKIYVEYKTELKSYMDQWVDYHENKEEQELKERQQYVEEVNRENAMKEHLKQV